MKIIDSNNLIPAGVLKQLIKNHPFSTNLYQQIHGITVSEDDSGIPRPRVNFNHETCEVILYLDPLFDQRSNYKYILYHELGHVADRLNPNFAYSEELKSSLSDHERYALMEVWNLYIDARLHHYGLFQLGRNDKNIYCRINGKLQIAPYSIEGKLLRHISSLRSVKIDNVDSIVKGIWENPMVFKSYRELISLIK